MKSRFLIICFFISFFNLVFCQSKGSDFKWLYLLDGYNSTDFSDLVVDKKGNSFVAVNYQAYLNIPELKKKLPNVGHVGGSIIKIDKNGKPLWAHAIVSSYDARIKDVLLAANGDILITGFCDGEVRFPSSGDTLTLGFPKPKNDYHQPQFIFIARYSTDGKRIWAKVLNQSWGEGWSIAENSKGDLYWSYYFRGQLKDGDKVVDSVPKIGKAQMAVGIKKLNARGEIIGNIPIQYLRDDYGSSYAPSLIVDKKDELILYGVFLKRIQFTEKDSLTNDSYYESSDAFIAKYATDGKFLWSRKIGGQNYQEIKDITIDQKNRIYLTGSYGYECVMSNGISLMQKSQYEYKSGSSFFYCRFSPDGELDFAKYHRQKGYNGSCFGTSLDLDSKGYIHLTGAFNDTLNFDGAIPMISAPNYPGQSFYCRWKLDTIKELDKVVHEEKGWASMAKIRIQGTHAVVGGSYYGANYMMNRNLKKFNFSEKDYGSSTFIYGFTVPELPEFEDETKDSAENLIVLKPVLECLSPDNQNDPTIWVPLHEQESDTNLSPVYSFEPAECGVRIENCSAILVPNPTRDKTDLILMGLKGDTQIEIFAASGQLMFSQMVTIAQEEQHFNLDFSEAINATYLVVITQNNYKKALRLVKM